MENGLFLKRVLLLSVSALYIDLAGGVVGA